MSLLKWRTGIITFVILLSVPYLSGSHSPCCHISTTTVKVIPKCVWKIDDGYVCHLVQSDKETILFHLQNVSNSHSQHMLFIKHWSRLCAYWVTIAHYSDVIMSAMASQITGVLIVCTTVCSGADQSSASLAFVRGIHRWPVNSSHKGSVTRKMFLFDDVIMVCRCDVP